MSRINTNVQSLIGQRVLGQNNMSLSQSLERLSTGLRINRGKDDPAGLIASENLRSDLKGIDAAINNANRADQVVSIAEGGLQEISGHSDRGSGPDHGDGQHRRSLRRGEGSQPASDRLAAADDRPHLEHDVLPGHQAAQRQLRL